VDEVGGGWEEPYEAEEHGEACDHLGVDEALLGPGVGCVEGMEVFANDACDDLRVVSREYPFLCFDLDVKVREERIRKRSL
jgi:hypothetical protein